MRDDVLFVWAGSRKIVEEIQIVLEEELPVKLIPLTPSAKAQAEAVSDDALKPTAELLGMAEEEVPRG